MTIPDLCQRAQALCEQIAARDLGDTPLYVLPQSALARAYGDAGATYGCWSPSADLYYRDAIGDAWRGRGACVLINDLALREDHDEDFELHFFATALHEFAHVMERGVLFRERTDVAPDLVEARMKFESFALALQLAAPPTQRESQAALWAHGGPFVRVCLHLAFRADVVGERIGPALLCGGRRYGLSHAMRYGLALGQEPMRMRRLTFRDILATPAPKAFRHLWLQDACEWMDSNNGRAA
jgi:hypothetical protein